MMAANLLVKSFFSFYIHLKKEVTLEYFDNKIQNQVLDTF